MSLGIITDDPSGIEEEKNIIERSAQGETGGIEFGTITKDDLQKAEGLVQSANSKYTGSELGAYIGSISYVTSIARDIPYAMAGRRFIRGTSFNNRMGGAYARAVMLSWIDAVTKG